MLAVRHEGVDPVSQNVVEQEMRVRDGDVGAVVFARPLFEGAPTVKPFLNPAFGAALNQDASARRTDVRGAIQRADQGSRRAPDDNFYRAVR